jgi:autotransporter-associated beta strand protein
MSQNGASSTLNLPGGIVDINGNITDAGAGVSTFILDAATLDMHNFAIGGVSPIDNLQFRSGTLKNVGEINNGAGLTKTGPGTLYLNTNNTYTGPTNITQGTLFVVNSSGSATGPGLVTVAAGAELAGPGFIGGLVQNEGVVAPEGFNFNPVGTLTVNGTYSQFATGTLRIDIASAVSNDLLVVTGGGASVAAGTLDVQLVNGFSPAQGDSFTILEASFISGEFPTTNLPALASGLLWQVEYLSNAVRIAVVSDCPADFNADGGADFFDYLDFVDAFSANDPTADFNQDGEINFFDYLDFVDAFSVGC